MIKLPVINKGITLTEIPGEIAVYFEIGNCNRKCRGCHSPHLRTPIFRDLYTDLEDMLKYVRAERARGATAVVLMGGTTNGIETAVLVEVINALSKVLPVGIYSGADDGSSINRFLQVNARIIWLKTGAYVASKGGINVAGTNQRFYERCVGGWVNKTYLFRENPIVPHCEEEPDTERSPYD